MNISHHREYTRARIITDLNSLKEHESVPMALQHCIDRLDATSDLHTLLMNARDFYIAEQDGDGEAMEEAANFLHGAACDIQRSACT